MAEGPLIRVENLHRHFQMGSEKVLALDGVTLELESGEFFGVSGPSGSGKSTLLYLLGGLDRPTKGHILVRGQDITTHDADELSLYRQRTVGFVFQMFNLIPTMTALENVEFPMIFSNPDPKQRQARANELLVEVGLADRTNHRPTELSGGQQQRVALARALANDPAILLADEPTGNLDSHSGGEVLQLLVQLNARGRTIVLVSHDPNVITAAGRSVRLYDGKIDDGAAPDHVSLEEGLHA